MGWLDEILDSLTLPTTAGDTDPRIVIGQQIPADLQAQYSATPPQDPVTSVIVMYDAGTGFYRYIAQFSGGGTGYGSQGPGGPYEMIFMAGTQLSMTDALYDPGYRSATEQWHNLTLQNGWTNFGGAFVTGKYRRVPSPSQSTQIVGVFTPGTKANGTVVANVPDNSATPGGINYRPSNEVRSPAYASATTAGGETPAFDLKPNGDLICLGLPAGATVATINAIFPLDA